MKWDIFTSSHVQKYNNNSNHLVNDTGDLCPVARLLYLSTLETSRISPTKDSTLKACPAKEYLMISYLPRVFVNELVDHAAVSRIRPPTG